MKPLRPAHTAAGSPWFKELYEAFAPVRQEAAKYSDAEINAAIDEAVVAMRQKRAHPELNSDWEAEI